MSTAHDDGVTTDWDELDEPQLRVVSDDEKSPQVGRRRTLELVNGQRGPKQHPDNVRFLRNELGEGPLSWALMKDGKVARVSCIGEDGYIQPANPEDDNGPATVSAVTGRIVSTLLADAYFCFVTRKRKGGDEYKTEEWFPVGDADRAVELPDLLPNVKPLRGVTHTPMARKDGTVLDTPGYDEGTGYLYIPTVDVPKVPENPTEKDVENAVGLLRGMVDEFVWVGEHDEANFLGAMLTPLLRQVCPPPYKLVAIMARQPGSGKSLLNRILREVHGGVFRAEMPHDEAEIEKSVSSILHCTTAPVVQFDNVSGTLRSSKFAAVLTSSVYGGRILGVTQEVPMANDRLWTITGNNLNFGGDIPRRALWVTIDPKVPDPHLRTGFKLDIPTYIDRHRGDILHALLVLVRSWAVAGMTPAELSSSDDYAHWTSVVRGILRHAGVPGTFDHQDSAQQKVGSDDEGWGAFLEAVISVMGTNAWMVKDVVAKMPSTALSPQSAAGQLLLESLPGELFEKFNRSGTVGVSRSLGMWLKYRNGRWAGDLVCEQAGRDGHSKAPMWRVRRDGAPPVADTTETTKAEAARQTLAEALASDTEAPF